MKAQLLPALCATKARLEDNDPKNAMTTLLEAIEAAATIEAERGRAVEALGRIGQENCRLPPAGTPCTDENPPYWCVHQEARRALAPATPGVASPPLQPRDPWGRPGSPEHVAIWGAVNEYALTCGGDPSGHIYGNTRRQRAVVGVENAIRALATPPIPEKERT